MAEIAVIGSGVAGMGCAWWLTECGHTVTMYAGDGHVGGHSRTVLANTRQGRQVPVDAGFMVFNPTSYPNLAELFRRLQVPVQPAPMSFGVSLHEGDIEYSGARLTGLFAQPALALSAEHWRMLADTLRFYREAPQLLDSQDNPTLLDYLQSRHYSDGFVSRYLVPMGAAIWSMPPARLMDIPARTFIRFCRDHGLLQLRNRPAWYTVTGGCIEYVRRLAEKFSDRIMPVAATRIKRTKAGPLVESNGTYKAYDAVVLACHADEALTLIVDPTPDEQDVLGAFRFEHNNAVLHQDDALMPKRGGAWSSWNYLSHPEGKASYTCWMNNLQDIDDETPLFLTINPPALPRPELTLARIDYSQPVFDATSLMAQPYISHLQGTGGLWFCGAWTGYGLHEDGLTSGLAVAEYLTGQARPWNVREASPAAFNVRPVTDVAEAA